MFARDVLRELLEDVAPSIRLRRLVGAVRAHFGCGAVGLLKLDEEGMRPLAVDGLAHETLGRHFLLNQHPRLAAIMAGQGPVRFAPGSPLPDPYDGLLHHHLGAPLPVHDCVGVCLWVKGARWGALTLDALAGSPFDAAAQAELEEVVGVAELVVQVAWLEEENCRLRAGRIVQQFAEPAVSSEATAVGGIVGRSAPLLALLNELDVVAGADLPVLLLGETGVGKELFARRVHAASRRAGKPLVQVNCAALPESLAESELFGHVKGAFSGAIGERAGRIEAAEGGTLFLDEVGELPLPVQAKLLRTLQNGEVQRLGADQPHKVDVRIVAATNRALPDLVREGRFRADLYHRLSVYPVQIPPLRERGQDVLLIAGHFLEINRARLGVRGVRLSPEAEQALCSYAWPGNVRELEHVISRAAVRAFGQGTDRNGIVTLSADLLGLEPAHGTAQAAMAAVSADGAAEDDTEPDRTPPFKTAVEDYQRQLLRQALARHGGNWAQAARALALDASNLHKLARRLGLK